jgi:hypothetical protein
MCVCRGIQIEEPFTVLPMGSFSRVIAQNALEVAEQREGMCMLKSNVSVVSRSCCSPELLGCACMHIASGVASVVI